MRRMRSKFGMWKQMRLGWVMSVCSPICLSAAEFGSFSTNGFSVNSATHATNYGADKQWIWNRINMKSSRKRKYHAYGFTACAFGVRLWGIFGTASPISAGKYASISFCDPSLLQEMAHFNRIGRLIVLLHLQSTQKKRWPRVVLNYHTVQFSLRETSISHARLWTSNIWNHHTFHLCLGLQMEPLRTCSKILLV